MIFHSCYYCYYYYNYYYYYYYYIYLSENDGGGVLPLTDDVLEQLREKDPEVQEAK